MAGRRPRTSGKQRLLADSGTLNPHPEAVVDLLFQTEGFFDPFDSLQVKYEMLRRVGTDAGSVTKAARAFGFSRRHFYEIKKQFDERGLQGLLSDKRGPKGAHKLEDSVMAFVHKTIEKEPRIKAKQLSTLIAREFEIEVHPRSVERALARKKKPKLRSRGARR